MYFCANCIYTAFLNSNLSLKPGMLSTVLRPSLRGQPYRKIKKPQHNATVKKGNKTSVTDAGIIEMKGVYAIYVNRRMPDYRPVRVSFDCSGICFKLLNVSVHVIYNAFNFHSLCEHTEKVLFFANFLDKLVFLFE